MERTIKFRGLRMDGKGWVYGDLMSIWTDPTIVNEQDGNDHLVIPQTVGQFTGILDADGLEIYEGDILFQKYSSQRKSDGKINETIDTGEVSFGLYDMEGEYEDTSSYGWLLGTYQLTPFMIKQEHNNPYWFLIEGDCHLRVKGNIHEQQKGG